MFRDTWIFVIISQGFAPLFTVVFDFRVGGYNLSLFALWPSLEFGHKQTNSIDYAVVKWRMFHLHLGDQLRSDGFMSRTKESLLIYYDVDNTRLLILDVNDHKLELPIVFPILEKNWPEVLVSMAVKKGTGDLYRHLINRQQPGEKKSIEDVPLSNQYFYLNQSNTVYFPPGGGFDEHGNAKLNRAIKDIFERWFDSKRKLFVDDVEKFIKLVEAVKKVKLNNKLHIIMTVSDKKAIFSEAHTGMMLHEDHLPRKADLQFSFQAGLYYETAD